MQYLGVAVLGVAVLGTGVLGAAVLGTAVLGVAVLGTAVLHPHTRLLLAQQGIFTESCNAQVVRNRLSS